MKNILLLFSLFTVSVFSQISISIPEIQRFKVSNESSGQFIHTSGVVTAVILGNSNTSGFYIQDVQSNSDSNISNGIFVYSSSVNSLSIGDEVVLQAAISGDDFFPNLIQKDSLILLSKNNAVTPFKIKYSLQNANLQAYRGMLVEFDQTLWVNDNYNLERYGELELGVKRKPIPVNLALPRSAGYTALVNENALPSIFLDDGNSAQNVTPIVFADPITGTRRMGERVDNLVGVLDYVSGRWVLIPSGFPVHFYGNPRNRNHADIGSYNLKVCGFNLEYFLSKPNTSNSMGPSTQVQLDRQFAKIVDAVYAIDADVYGLVEIEMGQTALAKLAQALNAKAGTNQYTYINDGSAVNGTFTKAAYLYRSDKVAPYGSMISINNPSPTNRKKIQGFTLKSNNERFIFSVNHFKAKSGCPASGLDSDQRDGQGCFNATRTAEANAVISNLASAKTTFGDEDILIMGDLNAYAMEDPIQRFVNAGYEDLHRKFHADSAYSYVYYSEAGYLDHAIASESMSKQVTGVTTFHINSDELRTFGYSGSKYDVGMFRSSDHDPVIVGIALGKNGNGEISDNNLKIYPTMVSDALNIEVDENAIAQIYTLSGVKIYERTIENQKIDIKENGFISGAYILRVLQNNRIYQQVIFVK